MKKSLLTVLMAVCGMVATAQSYGILVNGKMYFAGEPTSEFEGFQQYLINKRNGRSIRVGIIFILIANIKNNLIIAALSFSIVGSKFLDGINSQPVSFSDKGAYHTGGTQNKINALVQL